MALLELDEVAFAYHGGPPILEHATASIGSGELVGILGPNGAGKSTLLRLALGIERSTRGRVLLDGRLVSDWSPKERSRIVAAVLQEEPSSFPYTVEETVLLGRIPHTGQLGFEGASDREAAEAAMHATGVVELRRRPITELSGGERKRALLARALCQSPKLLVLDEPAAALDIHHQIAIFDELAGRVAQGLSVVAVFHDLNLAAQYCTRLILCRPGQPIAVGTIAEILTYAKVREAFGIDVYVGVNELTQDRFLIPMRARPK